MVGSIQFRVNPANLHRWRQFLRVKADNSKARHTLLPQRPPPERHQFRYRSLKPSSVYFTGDFHHLPTKVKAEEIASPVASFQHHRFSQPRPGDLWLEASEIIIPTNAASQSAFFSVCQPTSATSCSRIAPR